LDQCILTSDEAHDRLRNFSGDERSTGAAWMGASVTAAWITPLILCVWMLMYSTISAPEDYKASQYGTKSILPPAVLLLVKLATRVGPIGLLTFAVFSLWRHPKRDPVLKRLSLLIVFGFYGFASVMWSADRGISLKQIISFGILIALAYGVAILWRSDADSRRLLTHLSICLWVMAVMLLIVHFAIPGVGALTKKSSGIFHSTGASAASGLGILLITGLRLLWKSEYSRWWPVIIAIHVGVLLVAGNRLSVAITGLVLVGLVACYCHRGWLAACVFSISLLGTTYLLVDTRMEGVHFAADSLGMFAKQGQSKKELSSLSGREEMWTKMWDSYLDSPIIGHGYFVTSKNGRIYIWYEWGNWTAHNFWLQALTTTGAVGLSLLMSGLFWIAIGMARGRKRIAESGRSVVMIFALTAWYFGWGFLNSSFIGPLSPESVVFAIILGIATAIAAGERFSVPASKQQSSASESTENQTWRLTP